MCGTITVRNPKANYVGSVVGPSTLERGESAIYYHDLGPGAKYEGSLPGTPFDNELGRGVICTMPGNATGSYTVKFSGACGAKADASVQSTGGLIGIISFPATSSTGSLTHEAIGAGNYYTINKSWYSFWDSDSSPLCAPSCWFSSKNLTISASGDTLTVHLFDGHYSDNRGSISVEVYRS